MNGLYLYCIRKRQNEKILIPGISDQKMAFSIPYQKLEAIVSEIPLDQFTDEKLKNKVQEDLNWIKENALRHEAVIEKAMTGYGKMYPVIPLKFGTVFNNREKVADMLKSSYQHYYETLTDLDKKQEWSVKVYLEQRDVVEQEVIANEKSILSKKAEIAAMPKGMAYFFESQLKNMVETSVQSTITNYTHTFFTSLGAYAQKSLKGKLLEKDLTGKKEPMILNAIYLIYEDKISAFLNEFENLSTDMKSKGFQCECGGPWPPYNFVKACENARD